MSQLENETKLAIMKQHVLPVMLLQEKIQPAPRQAPAKPTAPFFWGLAGVAVFIFLWQLAISLHVLGPQFGPAFSPLKAGQALVELTATGILWPHLQDSMRRVVVGLLLAAGAGIPVGVIFGYYRLAESASGIVFQFLRMISPLAWMPIAIIIFGVGDRPIYFLIAIAAVWPFIINTAHGVSRVNPLWIKIARNLGATEWHVLQRVVIPAVIPDILTGLRLAIGMAWVMLVPDEMLGVSSGLGYFILDTRDRFRYDQLMAAILLIGLIGYLLDGLVKMVQRRYSWTIE